MRCDQCLTEVPDGTAICPACDAILDQSFLAELDESADADQASSQASPAGLPAHPPTPRSGQGTDPSVVLRPVGQTAPPVAAEQSLAFQREVATSMIELDPERDRATRITRLADLPDSPRHPGHSRAVGLAGPQPAAAAATGMRPISAPRREGALRRLRGLDLDESTVSRDVDATLVWLRDAYRRLDRVDRAILFALGALFLASLLPWFHTRGIGLIAGVQDYGALSAAFASLALVAFGIRASRRRRSGTLVFVELACVLLATAVVCYRGLMPTEVGSRAVAGLYLTALAGLSAVGASLARLVKG